MNLFTRLGAPMLIGLATHTVTFASSDPMYDAVIAGKRCSESNQQLTCEYRVGRSLYFSIVGIGMPDTGVTFFKVDWDGDYYATYALLHGCVIVKPGRKAPPSIGLSFAFVSPANGKIYRTWEECRAGY